MSLVADSDIHAFIQAGGRSSRMGTDKAWLEINGRPMIEHVLAAAEPIAAGLSIVINSASPNEGRYRELAEKWNARLLYDLHDHKGPLGGIHTALKNCGENDAALILACDLPFLTTEFLNFLCQKHRSGNAAITVPTDQNNHLQPLVAIYNLACLPAIEEMVSNDKLRVDGLFEKASTEIINFAAIAQLPASDKFFSNLNSSLDYQNATNHLPR